MEQGTKSRPDQEEPNRIRIGIGCRIHSDFATVGDQIPRDSIHMEKALTLANLVEDTPRRGATENGRDAPPADVYIDGSRFARELT